MAKITQYPAKTVPSNNDEFVLHDTAAGSTKKMTRGDLIGGAPLPANSVDGQAIADSAVTANEIDFATLATTLYTGPSGVTGTISLSQPATSFRSVEIEFDRPSAGVSTIVIRGMSTDIQYSLTLTNRSAATVTTYSCKVSLGAGGNTIQLVGGGAVALNSTGVAGFAPANEIRILKVTGCK